MSAKKNNESNESKELVEQGSNLPAYLQNQNGSMGFENVRKEDLLIPRLKLLQALSPEVQEGDGKAGDIVNSLTGENYGQEITFVPITSTFTRAYWESTDRDAKVLCSSLDGKVPSPQVEKPLAKDCSSCPFSKFTKDASGKDIKPACTEFSNVPVLLKSGEPAALSFSRTKQAAYKRFVSMATLASKGKIPLFGLQFKIKSKLEKSPKGTYYNYEIIGDGYAAQEVFEIAKRFYDGMKDKIVRVHEEAPVEQPATSGEKAEY